MKEACRTILAQNIRRMIAADAGNGRPSVRAWAMSKGLDVRLIDRVVNGKHAVGLDKLEEIASALGLKPWHLLLEDLDPAKPPDAPITPEERTLLARLQLLMKK